MDQRPKCNNLNVMCFLTRKHRSKFLQPWVKKCFLRCDTKNTSKKKKENRYIRPYKNFKFLYFKRYHQESENTTHKMGKILANQYLTKYLY